MKNGMYGISFDNKKKIVLVWKKTSALKSDKEIEIFRIDILYYYYYFWYKSYSGMIISWYLMNVIWICRSWNIWIIMWYTFDCHIVNTEHRVNMFKCRHQMNILWIRFCCLEDSHALLQYICVLLYSLF